MEGRKRRDEEAEQWLLGTTLHNSSFQELRLGGGGGRVGSVWAHWYFKIVFLLEKAFYSTLSNMHALTLTPISTCTHLHVSPARALTMFSYHTYVHAQMSL